MAYWDDVLSMLLALAMFAGAVGLLCLLLIAMRFADKRWPALSRPEARRDLRFRS